MRGLALSRRSALPVFGSDALSGVAYAPDEVLMVLAAGGAPALLFSPAVGLAISVVLLIVIGTYRYNLRHVVTAGGDYQVVSERLGPVTGVVAASSMLLDFVLAVAVSVSAATTYASVLAPPLAAHRVPVAVAGVLLLSVLFLRGIRFMARLARFPAYLFGALMVAMLAIGIVRTWVGHLSPVPSAQYSVAPQDPGEQALGGLGLLLLMARAFSSGAVTLTGVESVSNAVRFFRVPRARSAASVLMVGGVASALILVGVLYLARMAGVVVTTGSQQLLLHGRPVPAQTPQAPVLAQVAQAVFGSGPMVQILAALTVLLLMVATVAAFTGFPLLASTMAGRGYLPVHFQIRTNRGLFANGVLVLGAGACLLVWAFGADVNALVQLYVIGALISMALTQAAVIRTRQQELRMVLSRGPRRELLQAQAVTVLGFLATVLALAVVVVTKLGSGAWVSLVVVLCLTLTSLAVKKHYTSAEQETAVDADAPPETMPSRIRALVLVTAVDRPALRALACARATRPASVEALAPEVDRSRTRRIQQQWQEREVPVPLSILASPWRDPVAPVVEHVRRIRAKAPRDLIMVYVPQQVQAHRWQGLLHRRTGAKIARRLAAEPGAVVVTVPWQAGQDRPDHAAPQERTSA